MFLAIIGRKKAGVLIAVLETRGMFRADIFWQFAKLGGMKKNNKVSTLKDFLFKAKYIYYYYYYSVLCTFFADSLLRYILSVPE